MDTPTPDNQPVPSPPAETADSAALPKKPEHHELKLEAPVHPAPAVESSPAPPANGPIATPPSVQPPPPPSFKQAVDEAAVSGVNPVLADDVDVIEKEWVDRAEQVIKENADDPHVEEEEFEGLQVDYLKKRYGKDIKPAEDE